jgi:uncharacterized protein with PQ loop repeat
MHLTHEVIGIIAGILGLLGCIPYLASIFKRKTRPNKASWIIWALVGGLLAFSYFEDGDKNALWLPLSYFLGPFFIAILSFRYGYSEWSKLEIVCIIMAALSILPWLISANAVVTLLINVLIDSMAAVPTLIKSYREPESEDLTAWLIFLIAGTMELFAISTWDITSIYPLYLFFLTGSVVLLILAPSFLHGCLNRLIARINRNM